MAAGRSDARPRPRRRPGPERLRSRERTRGCERRRRAGRGALLLGVLLARIAAAAETDNLTYRYVPLEESAPKLDRVVNATLEAIAARANSRLRARPDPRSASDTEVELAFVDAYRDAVLRKFGDRLLPVFGACVESNDCEGWPRFERIVLLGRESVYDESRYNRIAMSSLAPTFRLCGARVGTDKLTHLFSNGFFYWNAGRQKGSRLRTEADALRLALADEDGLMGARSTGVSSPADAQATAAGYRLASSYFEGDDPVFARSRATGLLVRRRDVDVCRFVTPAWDEALDPPVFTEGRRPRERIEAAIAERVEANRAGASLPEGEKRRLERELTARALPPRHGRLSFPDKLWVALKWGTAYLTIPRESRRAIRALAFPRFRIDGRRPITLARAP